MRSTSPPLRVAIIGYGSAGSVLHAPIIASVAGLHVAAIVTRRPDRQALARRDFPDVPVFTSLEDCLSGTNLDIVVIATPNLTHRPLAQTALEAGKHVVVDKPIAPSVEDAQQLIGCAQRCGKVLTVFQNRRWDGDFLTVRRLIESGLLGNVYSFESRFENYEPFPQVDMWYDQQAQAGGLLYNLGSHLIDQAILLFGTVESVYAEMDFRRPSATADDVTFVALRFHSGVRAKIYLSDVARVAGPRFKVRGLLGGFQKYGMDPQEDVLRGGERPTNTAAWGREPRAAWGHLITEINGLALDTTIETMPGCYYCFYQGLRDAVHGKSVVPVDPLDSIPTLRIIEAAQRSSELGEVVKMQLQNPATVMG